MNYSSQKPRWSYCLGLGRVSPGRSEQVSRCCRRPARPYRGRDPPGDKRKLKPRRSIYYKLKHGPNSVGGTLRVHAERAGTLQGPRAWLRSRKEFAWRRRVNAGHASLVADRVQLANLRQCAVDQDLLGPRLWARFFLANPRQVLARFDDISFLLSYLCRPR